MVVGLDFDNTIVDYGPIFHRAGMERGLLPPETPPTKSAVREALRRMNAEREWTLLQGHVYGTRMREADCYPGVFAFMETVRAGGHALCIISHKTRTPYMGPPHDLHEAARDFLEHKGLLNSSRTGLTKASVFFETGKAGKIERIKARQCDVFVDDLPEILADDAFPGTTVPVLFDPTGHHEHERRFCRVGSWHELQAWLADTALFRHEE